MKNYIDRFFEHDHQLSISEILDYLTKVNIREKLCIFFDFNSITCELANHFNQYLEGKGYVEFINKTVSQIPEYEVIIYIYDDFKMEGVKVKHLKQYSFNWFVDNNTGSFDNFEKRFLTVVEEINSIKL